MADSAPPAGVELKTLGDLKRLLMAGEPGTPLGAATLLYLHGVRISSSIRLKAREVDLSAKPATMSVDGHRVVYLTDELSTILRVLASSKARDDLLLGYASVSEFHRDFRRMVRTSKLVRFALSDIKEMFKASAGSDYLLLKQSDSAQPFTPDDVRRAWLKVLPRLVVGV